MKVSWKPFTCQIVFLLLESLVEGLAFLPFRSHIRLTSLGSMSGTVEGHATTNWRIISKHSSKDEVDDILSIRSTWSERQYQDSLDLYDRLISCKDLYIAAEIHAALGHLEQAYRLYGHRSVVCSYNGGKDAVVILHLMRASAANYYRQTREVIRDKPRAIYFDHEHEFPEILTLLHETVQQYDIDMIAFEKGISFVDGLKILVENDRAEHRPPKAPCAFVLGTRASDPNAGGQGYFAPSSPYMPPFMRVNPILDWTYGHIWHFLRLFHLPYCSLYDQGYTSLGTTKDTLPCPALCVEECSQTEHPRYLPAYILKDWNLERAGRISKGNAPMSVGVTNKNVTSSLTKSFQINDEPSFIGRNADSTYSFQATTNLTRDSTQLSSDGDIHSVEGEIIVGTVPSVGLLVIGDEILKGKIADVNTHTAAQSLRKRNVPLSKVSIISDNKEEIISEILRLRQEVDIVITSGGVGPTHDDITIRSVADALGEEMVFHEEMANVLRTKMSAGDVNTSKLSQAQLKMATLPSSSKLMYLSTIEGDWPTLRCQNIFILPGIPQHFAKKIDAIANFLSSHSERNNSFKVILSVNESSIVPILNDIVGRHVSVSFGSYPFIGHPQVKTVITIESMSLVSLSKLDNASSLNLGKEEMDRNVKDALDSLVRTLEKQMPGSILRVENDDSTLFP